jgi:hypothetical protein
MTRLGLEHRVLFPVNNVFSTMETANFIEGILNLTIDQKRILGTDIHKH